MSLPAPTKIYRAFASRLWGYAFTAMSLDTPLPKRLAAIEMLRINFDQMFAPSFIPDAMKDLIAEGLELTYEYVKSRGYKINPPPIEMFGKSFLTKLKESAQNPEASKETNLLKWIRTEFERKKDESIMQYVNRASLLASRLLAIYSYVTASTVGL